jgi:aminoglycoside phosphotransferase (APT) family kinase protein
VSEPGPIPGPIIGPIIGRGNTAEVYASGEGEVVKLFRAGAPEAMVAGEFRSAGIASDAGIATPKPLRRVDIDGRMGIVFERVDGPTMMDDAGKRPWRLVSWARVLSRLEHSLAATASLTERTVKEYVRPKLLRADIAEDVREMLVSRLDRLPDGDALVHLDFHPGNVLIGAGGPVVIDWSNTSVGDPAADVAQTLLILSCGSPPEGTTLSLTVRIGRRAFSSAVRAEALRLDPSMKLRIDDWMPVLAGARLAERNHGEREPLLYIIAEHMRRLR